LNRLYVVATWVPCRGSVVVGALGTITLERGWQAYVGSARRGRTARVARHLRAQKPLRWHADYLFARYPATRSWLVDTPLSECELALLLRRGVTTGPVGERCSGGADLPGETASPADRDIGRSERGLAARFGASDCACPGHLVAAPSLDALRAALAGVAAVGGRLRPGPVVVTGRNTTIRVEGKRHGG